MRVFLVEDEELIRLGISELTPWDDWGFELLGSAADAEEALPQILALRPDLVLTDICMPDMDGLEMIERISAELDCAFVVISGYSDFGYARRALQLQVSEYLLKPIDEEELKNALFQARDRLLKLRGQQGAGELLTIHDRFMKKALELLQSSYQERLTLRDLADRLCISESYLGKLFRQKTDYTFLEWLTFYRLKASLRLLRDENCKIYEVAERIGYNDAKYFSKVFLRVTGLHPMDIRRGKSLPQDCILRRI